MGASSRWLVSARTMLAVAELSLIAYQNCWKLLMHLHVKAVVTCAPHQLIQRAGIASMRTWARKGLQCCLPPFGVDQPAGKDDSRDPTEGSCDEHLTLQSFKTGKEDVTQSCLLVG